MSRINVDTVVSALIHRQDPQTRSLDPKRFRIFGAGNSFSCGTLKVIRYASPETALLHGHFLLTKNLNNTLRRGLNLLRGDGRPNGATCRGIGRVSGDGILS